MEAMMPDIFEWILILFQPMPHSSLLSLLEIMRIGGGAYVVLILYALLAFVFYLFLRHASIQARWAIRGYDRPGGIMMAMGIGLGGLSLLALWPEMREHLSAATGASYLTGIGPLPSLHVFHRAIMPLDIEGVSQFTEDAWGRQIQTAFIMWYESTRGLFVYPALIALCVIPWLRSLTAPLVLGLVAGYTVPAVLISFWAVGVIPFWIATGFIFLAVGGLGSTRRWILDRE
ncbi:hypothetical protein [Paracoccus sp. ME4]|uniref:hypothetical protein n=1 Tax=Paracoccus sp. ME4 TaxID=3138066 RepID=UPI00398A5E62